MRLRTNKETENAVWKPKRRKKNQPENQQNTLNHQNNILNQQNDKLNQEKENLNQQDTATVDQAPANQQQVDEPVASKREISLKEALEKLYTDTKSAPSYSAKINEFLRQNNVHSIHRRIIKKNFPRRKIIARFPFDIFMADLIEYPNLKFQNNRYVYILILIDCFTKKVWAMAMKEKSATWTADAFESIFKNLDDFPSHLITDGGLEFFNEKTQNVFRNYGVNHYKIPTKTKWKASIVERVNRTIKTRIQRYFFQNKTKKWIDIYEDVVKDYNNTPHSSIGIAPNQVSEDNRVAVYKRLYPDNLLRTVCKLQKRDKVRYLLDKEIFEKGYTKKWTEEIYQIYKIKQSNGVCYYYLESLAGDPLPGIYYYYQLNLVSRHADSS